MNRYECKICKYITNKNHNYKKHLLTKKHLNNTNNHLNKNTENSILIYPHLTSFNLIYPPLGQKVAITDNTYNIECKYCKTQISSKNINRHYMISCLDIPDDKKVKMILRHNKNSKTKNVIDIQEAINSNIILSSNTTGNTITNIVNNNTINNNIQLNINSIGKESIEHISFQRMIEILESKNKMIKEFCKELYKLDENKNAFIDVRNKLIYFVNDNKQVELEHMNEMLSIIVDKYVKKINDYYTKNITIFDDRTKKLFKDTYDTFFCIINISNYDDKDYIESENKLIIKKFNDDMRLSLYKIKDDCKCLLN